MTPPGRKNDSDLGGCTTEGVYLGQESSPRAQEKFWAQNEPGYEGGGHCVPEKCNGSTGVTDAPA